MMHEAASSQCVRTILIARRDEAGPTRKLEEGLLPLLFGALLVIL